MPKKQVPASSLRLPWALPGLELWLIRHGETAWSASGRLTGHTDIPLSRQGRLQAAALGSELTEAQPAQAWTSDLLRCRQTAQIAGLEARPDTRLRELDFGTLEGTTWNQLSATHRRWLADFDQFVAPGGESVTDLKARIHAFLSELDIGRHIIVTHGGVIRLICREIGQDQYIGAGTVTKLGPDP